MNNNTTKVPKKEETKSKSFSFSFLEDLLVYGTTVMFLIIVLVLFIFCYTMNFFELIHLEDL